MLKIREKSQALASKREIQEDQYESAPFSQIQSNQKRRDGGVDRENIGGIEREREKDPRWKARGR